MNLLRNERGQLTLEFMMGIILVVTVSTLVGVMTFTLSLTEALQYVTYSSARTYMAGDMDPSTQQQAGIAKATTLLQTLPFLSSAQQSGWIKIPKVTNQTVSDNFSQYAQNLGVDFSSPSRDQFQGVQIQFTVPMLNIQLPFLKQAITPPNGAQDFQATLSSFLTREPSFQECSQYLTAALQKLKDQYSVQSSAAILIIDNGC